jgi:tetratricopeptide (TPR) repeat protein
LILSASRGSWLGLAAGAGGAFLLANGRLSRLLGRRGWTLAVILGTALACGLLFWAVVTFPRAGRLAGTVTGTAGSAAGRAALWREMLDLFRDYPFTGSGLGSTTLVFSSYVLLVHVGFIGHSHNIFLQVGIEQGVAGLLAFAALLGLAAWRVLRAGQADGGAAPRRATPRNGRTASNGGPRAGSDADAGSLFRIAAGAALIVLVISGMTDAGIYVSKAVPALFIALGFVLAAGQVETRPARPVETARRQAVAPFVFSAAALVLVIVALLPSTRAALQSNLGAVAQTRAELSVYEWPKWPIQDALRRSPSVDLVPALARYGAALALNPQDVTANRRLGQIELSRGDYETARRHLERAYQAAPRSPASRQLLGESYAIAGDSGQAAALWRGLDLAYGQLDARQWWYQHIGEKARAAAISQAARLIN